MFYRLCKCFSNVVLVTFTVVNDETHPCLLLVTELKFTVLFQGSTDRHAHS